MPSIPGKPEKRNPGAARAERFAADNLLAAEIIQAGQYEGLLREWADAILSHRRGQGRLFA